MSEISAKNLLAVVYDDGIAADRLLSALGYALRDRKVAVRGLVQRNSFRRDRAKCDMELEELGSGEVLQLSRDRGAYAGGCHLDREAIVTAAALIGQKLDDECEVLIINKFGRSEAEGGGLRDIIAEAVSRGLVTVIGVPRRNLEIWEKFAEGLFERCDADDVRSILTWLGRRTGVESVTGVSNAAGRDLAVQARN